MGPVLWDALLSCFSLHLPTPTHRRLDPLILTPSCASSDRAATASQGECICAVTLCMCAATHQCTTGVVLVQAASGIRGCRSCCCCLLFKLGLSTAMIVLLSRCSFLYKMFGWPCWAQSLLTDRAFFFIHGLCQIWSTNSPPNGMPVTAEETMPWFLALSAPFLSHKVT